MRIEKKKVPSVADIQAQSGKYTTIERFAQFLKRDYSDKIAALFREKFTYKNRVITYETAFERRDLLLGKREVPTFGRTASPGADLSFKFKRPRRKYPAHAH